MGVGIEGARTRWPPCTRPTYGKPHIGDIVHCDDFGRPCNSVWVVVGEHDSSGGARLSLLYIHKIGRWSGVPWALGYMGYGKTFLDRETTSTAWHLAEVQ